MNMYYNSVGHNSTLIMGLTPDTTGLLPEADVQRLKEWGDEIEKQFKNPIAKTNGEGNTVEIKLPKLTEINHIVLQEDIVNGERTREYKIEALIKGKWLEVGTGTCIGHKRIQKIETIETASIRLKIIDSIAKPLIMNFSVYHIN
jgi:alpha-L-fucosidase